MSLPNLPVLASDYTVSVNASVNWILASGAVPLKHVLGTAAIGNTAADGMIAPSALGPDPSPFVGTSNDAASVADSGVAV